MNGIEIRTRINKNNDLISELLNPSSFTLNNTIASILEENKKLQMQCIHQFDEGYCIFCDKAEDE